MFFSFLLKTFPLETRERKRKKPVKGYKGGSQEAALFGLAWEKERAPQAMHLTHLLSQGLLCPFCVSGGYEPPLTNVFTMQWFLTLFATCLPNHTVLKIWDSVFFEGSEIILRVSLAIWAKLGE